MRLIDADTLIADCQLAQKQADRHGREFANAFYSGGGEVATEWWCVEDMIENAPTIEPERKTGRWIPCSERLPDNKGYVLVTDYGETNIGRRYCGRWWLDYCGDKMKDVTAWMPLPEPYMEGE